ncbi:MAG: DUF2235 domain-containing protein [Burkholderiaceae bacterium]|nr:DUF2235 domain-containing protein [Burkholderiaceae bacterium]
MSDRPRQLVICCDGTNNNLTGGQADTNVVKLAQLMAQALPDAARLVFYDPGVGNAGELPGVTVIDRINRQAERWASLAFGRGVYENMEQCYQFLMNNYQPGDKIYIFGFSRGAFTARSFAGLINQFGILAPQMASMVPTLIQLYFSDRKLHLDQMKAIASQTTQLFAPAPSRYVEIQFVGVWDTVASVGLWPFNAKITAKPTIQGKRFVNVRHAMALDEHRAQFLPRLYTDNNSGGQVSYQTAQGTPASIKQLWFRGAHGDVGGGFGVGDTAISDQALMWMVSEAVRCGLRLADPTGPLDTQAAVGRVLQSFSPPAQRTVIHSQLRNVPWWALTGMQVRSTTAVVLDDGQTFAMQPVEHASVAAEPLSYPKDTAWAKPHDSLSFWIGVALTPVFMLLLGHFLTNPNNADIADIAAGLSFQNIGAYVNQNINFSNWQLFWLFNGNLETGIFQFASPRTALIFDLALIVTYAYVLSWLAVRAFAQIARLRRAGDGVVTLRTKWLNRLGWALPVAVFADVLENVSTWIVIECISANWPLRAKLVACLMSLFASAKFVGLLGVLLLLLWSVGERWTSKRAH